MSGLETAWLALSDGGFTILEGVRSADLGVEDDGVGVLEISEALEGIRSLEIGNWGDAVPGVAGFCCRGEVAVDMIGANCGFPHYARAMADQDGFRSIHFMIALDRSLSAKRIFVTLVNGKSARAHAGISTLKWRR